jgi:hypothetical protein
MPLDAAHAAQTLGDHLARRFLQHATPLAEGEVEGLMIRIDQHLSYVRRVGPDPELADTIGRTCKGLILRMTDLNLDGRAAVVGAVRYFLETLDMDSDLKPHGLADDALVLNYAIAVTGLDVDPISV